MSGLALVVLVGAPTVLPPTAAHKPHGYTLISTNLLSEMMATTAAELDTPPLPHTLKNRYFGLRHGLSEANVAGIISSDPAVGTKIHGLTPHGRIQARRAATALVDAVGRDNCHRLRFYASDFTRAWQTAEETQAAVVNLLEYECALVDDAGAVGGGLCADVERTPQIRERYFGELDGESLSTYGRSIDPVARANVLRTCSPPPPSLPLRSPGVAARPRLGDAWLQRHRDRGRSCGACAVAHTRARGAARGRVSGARVARGHAADCTVLHRGRRRAHVFDVSLREWRGARAVAECGLVVTVSGSPLVQCGRGHVGRLGSFPRLLASALVC